MPKQKPNKSLLKRIKITAKGKVKWRRANAGHLMSHKTGAKVRGLRKKRVAKSADIRRLKRMLHRPLTGCDAGPAPAVKPEAQAAAAVA